MRLRTRLFGRELGDFHPQNNEPEELLRKTRYCLDVCLDHVLPVFSPRVAFTNRVAAGHPVNPWSFSLTHSKETADGGVVQGPRQAVAIFNADSPIVCLSQKEKLAVLHAGYRCLVRPDKDEPNILEAAISHFDPQETAAWIGYGIGPCCWTPKTGNYPEIQDPKRCRHPQLLSRCLGKTTRSPFGCKATNVDLYALAHGLLLKIGIQPKNINWDTCCTCCASKDGQPVYWSHTRFKKEGGTDGRNFCLAWLQY